MADAQTKDALEIAQLRAKYKPIIEGLRERLKSASTKQDIVAFRPRRGPTEFTSQAKLLDSKIKLTEGWLEALSPRTIITHSSDADSLDRKLEDLLSDLMKSL